MKEKYIWPFFLVIVLCGIALATWHFTKTNWKLGLDEIFNTLNTLFSGLAFAGVLCALFLQRQDLKNQLKELTLQREVQQQSNKEFRLQNEALRLQSFENTFFQMLHLNNQIINDLRYGGNLGREVISAGLTLLLNQLEQERKDALEKYNSINDKTVISGAFASFYKGFENRIGHYLNHLQKTYEFVHGSPEITSDQQEFYASLVTSKLSLDERVLILYFGLSFYGTGFLPLIKEYQIVGSLNNYKTELIPDWVLEYHRKVN